MCGIFERRAWRESLRRTLGVVAGIAYSPVRPFSRTNVPSIPAKCVLKSWAKPASRSSTAATNEPCTHMSHLLPTSFHFRTSYFLTFDFSTSHSVFYFHFRPAYITNGAKSRGRITGRVVRSRHRAGAHRSRGVPNCRAQNIRLAARAHGRSRHRTQRHRARRNRRVLPAQPAAARRHDGPGRASFTRASSTI